MYIALTVRANLGKNVFLHLDSHRRDIYYKKEVILFMI